jgi:hypothetical protein
MHATAEAGGSLGNGSLELLVLLYVLPERLVKRVKQNAHL